VDAEKYSGDGRRPAFQVRPGGHSRRFLASSRVRTPDATCPPAGSQDITIVM